MRAVASVDPFFAGGIVARALDAGQGGMRAILIRPVRRTGRQGLSACPDRKPPHARLAPKPAGVDAMAAYALPSAAPTGCRPPQGSRTRPSASR